MAFDIIIEPFAETDVKEITDWYELQKSGLGINFTREFIRNTTLLSATPFLFRKKHQDIRAMPMQTFPYGIYYFVNSGNVYIIAIIHHKRNPKIWKQRKNKS